jgi:steroid 5-alpha reductase family enzyme
MTEAAHGYAADKMSWTLTSSRAVYAASYVVAAGVVAAVMMTVPFSSQFAAAAVAGAAATVFLYGCSLVFKNSGFYDVYWSLAPVAFGVVWIAQANAWAQPRAILALVVTAAWGLRLTTNWVKHYQGLDVEDWRYVDLRKKTGGAYPVASFFALHVFPFTLVTLGTLPLHEAIRSTTPLGILDFVGLAVGIGAVVLETVSDIQLHRFRRQNKDPARFLDTGLWAYSRHPNYCGEAMYWWAAALFGLAAHPSPAMVLGAIGVTSMILFASIPMAEKRALAKRPSFAAYQARVSRLVPWFPKG